MNGVLAKIERAVSFFLVILSVLMTGMQVFFRYLLNSPLSWTEEISRIALIWLVFWGSAIAFRNSEHLTITVLVQRLGRTARFVLSVVSNIIVLLFILAMTVTGFQVLGLTRNIGTPALGISTAWVYVIVPVSGLLMLFRIIVAVSDEVRKFYGAKPTRSSVEGG